MKWKGQNFGVKKTTKLDYKLNLRKAAAIIIPKIMEMMFCNNRKLSDMISKLIQCAKRYKSAIRMNRIFERKPNFSKHSVNYKRNFCLS